MHNRPIIRLDRRKIHYFIGIDASIGYNDHLGPSEVFEHRNVVRIHECSP